MAVSRSPDAASRNRYDLIVVGGGIYGVMIAREANRRGRSVLLLEKDDFGGATTYNSLRIIHGGLRDLQTLDLRRYWRFGRERRWFLRHFPRLVEPLPVLIPLYQRGMMRTGVFRAAFQLDRWLLPERHRRVDGERVVPPGRILSPEGVKDRFPAVAEPGLAGGALWYDAAVPDSQRIVMEVLRAWCRRGGTALNYAPAVDLLTERGRVAGVQARDRVSGRSYRFEARRVVNAAGPGARALARRFTGKDPDLCGCGIAWNVLLDRPAPSGCALGVRPDRPGGRYFFIHPWKGRFLAGTGRVEGNGDGEEARPSRGEMDTFLRDLEEALPGFDLGRDDVVRVFSGRVPVRDDGSLLKRDRWIDHGEDGGPEGLFTVQGTKFTGARATAEEAVGRIFEDRPDRSPEDPERDSTREADGRVRGVFGCRWRPEEEGDWREHLRSIVETESVVHLDDLLLRRTSLGDDPYRALEMAPDLCDLFDWDEARRRKELQRVRDCFPRITPSTSTADELL